ncbi:MAG: hypothetical protein O2968_16280 [Acidobacteria bacterium]|nr:hypothetical protein [Acidobacteriota bacterium]
MRKDQNWTAGGLIVSFLFACVYGLSVLLLTAHWFHELLRQPSWVVFVGILGALYIPVQIARSARQVRNFWRRKFYHPREQRVRI